MMFDYDVPSERIRRGLRFICDECGIKFIHSNNYQRALKRSRHFCKPSCAAPSRRKGGSIDNQKRLTCKERFGVDYPMQDKNVILKSRNTCLDRYGVDHPTKLESEKEKRRQTCLKLYGVDSILKLPDVRKKTTSCDSQQKKHQTMKKNGTYAVMTKPEWMMHRLLCEVFSEHNVSHNVFVKRWPIDFYVKGPDLYVQVDGVYWHGLDRPEDVIKEFRSQRDRTIMRKRLIDAEQNLWFQQHGLKLLRITDIQLKTNIDYVKLVLQRFI